jgi:hypothetical protein
MFVTPGAIVVPHRKRFEVHDAYAQFRCTPLRAAPLRIVLLIRTESLHDVMFYCAVLPGAPYRIYAA